MSIKKGFTLLELIVVIIIVGILAAVALPSYMTMILQRAAKAAQNNLISIYNAEKTDYLNNGSYCTAGCSSLATINTALSLNLTDNYFNTYTCSATNGFTCTATSASIPGGGSLSVTNNTVILPGGTGCTGPTYGVAPCNPICTLTSTYCPTS